MIEEKLNTIKEKIIEMAILVESMIEKSVKGLIERDKNLLLEVIEKDEKRVNDMELEIEDLGIKFIALYHPEAEYLRTSLMILQINNDLERMGDEAVNISESSLFLIERPPVKPLIDIPRMAKITNKMLKDSITSFVERKPDLAKEICAQDDIVDGLRDQIHRELITYMMHDPSTIERALHLLRIARSLERIADLSTNLCEDVIFMVRGKVIKHHKEEI
ncbi:MAG: phosphate signaling complex protein PhoU [Candidatus Aminicenantia bacterium]